MTEAIVEHIDRNAALAASETCPAREYVEGPTCTRLAGHGGRHDVPAVPGRRCLFFLYTRGVPPLQCARPDGHEGRCDYVR